MSKIPLIEMLKNQKLRDTVWVTLAAIIIFVDYLTDPFIQFPILFLIPVAFASIYSHKFWGNGLAIILPLIRFSLEIWKLPGSFFQELVNTGIRVVVLLGISILLVKYTKQKQALEKEVQTLRGILPICSSCKKIRIGKDNWEHIEDYISKRSDAKFSHGICPDCVRKLYPELRFDQKEKPE